jgi:hypothetical protein
LVAVLKTGFSVFKSAKKVLLL